MVVASFTLHSITMIQMILTAFKGKHEKQVQLLCIFLQKRLTYLAFDATTHEKETLF